MKRKSMILAVVLLAVMVAPLWAQNASDFTTDGRGTITGYTGWDTNIVIPAQINGVTITAIGNSALNNLGLTSVTLPASIKRIGKGAFNENKMTTVTISDAVTIDDSAFSKGQLTSLTIGNGCTIANNAFDSNRALKDLVLGANISFKHTFGYFVYYEYMCNNRRAGTYDAKVKYDTKREGDYRFIETKYGSVIIEYTGSEGNRLIIPRQLGGAAVKGIEGKEGFIMQKGAFEGKSVSRMQLPDSLIFIGENAFYFNSLTSVTIPAGVISIGAGAFLNNGFSSITIPKSVISIGGDAFSSDSLTSVTFEGTIAADNFGSKSPFDLTGKFTSPFKDDLRDKYLARGIGTYTKPNTGSRIWLKQ